MPNGTIKYIPLDKASHGTSQQNWHSQYTCVSSGRAPTLQLAGRSIQFSAHTSKCERNGHAKKSFH